jgi:hypothetical protein
MDRSKKSDEALARALNLRAFPASHSVLPEVEELWREKYPNKKWLLWLCDSGTVVNGTRLRCVFWGKDISHSVYGNGLPHGVHSIIAAPQKRGNNLPTCLLVCCDQKYILSSKRIVLEGSSG